MIFYKSDLPFPFAKATEVNNVLYLSGQVSMDNTGKPIYGNINQQTEIIMVNLQKTLQELGSSLDQVFKVTVWLSDMSYFQNFNQTYQKFFKENFPARSVIASQLAFNLDVEIELQAIKIEK